MTEIVNVDGDYTDNLDINFDTVGGAVYDDALYSITGLFSPTDSPAITVLGTSADVHLVFRNGGSIHNTSSNGRGILATDPITGDLRITVESGSAIYTRQSAIDITSSFTLVNRGSIVSEANPLAGEYTVKAGGLATIVNYGEISGAYGTSTLVRNSIQADLVDLRNYGIIEGRINGTDEPGTHKIRNFGTINGGIDFYPTSNSVSNAEISNAGLINGRIVVAGWLVLDNTGTLQASNEFTNVINTAGGEIRNFGTIIGIVSFRESGVFYNLSGGVITGSVSGGSLTDVFDGNDTAERFFGGGGDDLISGRGGNDVLTGGSGNDQLAGGVGDDRYEVDSQDDIITELSGDGRDTVTARASYALDADAEIEIFTAAPNVSAGISLTGNTFVQAITGSQHADTLSGGGNGDTLTGLAGDDIYALGANTATIVEAPGSAGGADLITSTITRSLVPFGAIERLTLLGTGNGTGNGLANIITGSATANTLDGGLGNDTLFGMGGNDILIGGLGRDTMTGGANNDIFRFAAASHSAVGVNTADLITDFDDNGNDTIDVSALFGPAMTYRHNGAFTAAGQVRINDIAGADLLVEVNTGGSLAADFAIRLTATTLGSMTASDFIL